MNDLWYSGGGVDVWNVPRPRMYYHDCISGAGVTKCIVNKTLAVEV